MSLQQTASESPAMPLTPQARVRRQVCAQILPHLAQLIYQADRGSPHAQLTDLSEDGRAVYLADAQLILADEQRQERVTRTNRAEAHTHAQVADERMTMQQQARRDIDRYGRRVCYVCGEPVLTNAATLFLSARMAAPVHGLCCAKDEARYEFVSEFEYRARTSDALLGDGRF